RQKGRLRLRNQRQKGRLRLRNQRQKGRLRLRNQRQKGRLPLDLESVEALKEGHHITKESKLF
ncbi:MAG: hypothetical protein ACJZ4F_01580, partial [Candidatus Thalassarchaeaceae archaeon]